MKIKYKKLLLISLVSISAGCQSNSNSQATTPTISTTVSQNNLISYTVFVKNTSSSPLTGVEIQSLGAIPNLNIKPGETNPCQNITSSNPLALNQTCSLEIENSQTNQPVNESIESVKLTPTAASNIDGLPVILSINSGTYLYAAGLFTQAGGKTANYIAKWNGNNWSPVGTGSEIESQIYTINYFKNNLYVGGGWLNAGGNANFILKWDGVSWSPLNTAQAVNGIVYSLSSSDSMLYAAGGFTNPQNYIAAWNDTGWSSSLPGMQRSDNGTFGNIAVGSSNTLYAAGSSGSFDKAVIQWNGSSWLELGTLTGYGINSLLPLGNELYVGGVFTEIGGQTVNNIAEWNGNTNTWLPLSDGISGSVNTIANSGNSIVIGGSFSNQGNNVAIWNGNSWSNLGEGITGNGVNSLAVSGNIIYAAGNFTEAGGQPANNLAEWNGNNWIPLGLGVNNTINSIILAPSLEVSN